VQPVDTIDENVIGLLSSLGMSSESLRPKHDKEFAESGAADLDFVFTVSDTAAGEPMPEWPGQPVTAHWSCPDPVLATGNEVERKLAYRRTLTEFERRLAIFVNLPFPSLDRMSLKARINELGRATSPQNA